MKGRPLHLLRLLRFIDGEPGDPGTASPPDAQAGKPGLEFFVPRADCQLDDSWKGPGNLRFHFAALLLTTKDPWSADMPCSIRTRAMLSEIAFAQARPSMPDLLSVPFATSNENR